MQEITRFLTKAKEAGIIDASQADRMSVLWAENSGIAKPAGDGIFDDLSSSNDAVDDSIAEPTEAPRLIRGFHDVLITVGLIAALGGLWALGSVFLVIPAIIILAEIFVRRQKLALPGFVLTWGLAQSVGAVPLLATRGNDDGWTFVFVFALLAVSMLGFYWRYKVPVALASVIASSFLLAFFLIVSGLGEATGSGKLGDLDYRTVGIIGFVLALGLFSTAMKFDLADPVRLTRRSDVAFWLHLTTAPLILYSMFLLIFGETGFWWADDPSSLDAFIAVLLISVMIIVGIVIDRRAFVTSGLISLGVALFILTKDSGVNVTNVSALSFLAVGVIVLALGTGWQSLRKVIVSSLPGNWQAALPPAE